MIFSFFLCAQIPAESTSHAPTFFKNKLCFLPDDKKPNTYKLLSIWFTAIIFKNKFWLITRKRMSNTSNWGYNTHDKV